MTEWRKVDDLKPAPVRHGELPAHLVARIDTLRSTLDEVYPQPMAEWLDGFQRDANPEGEILWWERLTSCYTEYSSTRQLNSQQRRAAFNVMLKLLLGSSENEIASDFAALPQGALDEILERLRRTDTPR